VQLQAVGISHRFFSLPILEVYHKTGNLSSLLTLKIRYHYRYHHYHYYYHHYHYHSPPTTTSTLPQIPSSVKLDKTPLS